MRKIPLSQLSSDMLLHRFEDLCLLQYRSLEREEIAAFNKRFNEIEAVVEELKSRPGDQRHLLQKFFDHRNSQVALTAAYANLTLDYLRAREVFKEISEHEIGIQQLDAGMTLQALDDGTYRPT